MSKKKLVVGVDSGFNEDYKTFLEKKYEIETVSFGALSKGENEKRPDLLLFTGGADVNPDLYGENVGKYTTVNAKRDELERRVFDLYYEIPKLGICRGSQALTVFNGGRLIQHVEGHTSSHVMHTKTYEEDYFNAFVITSTHHQMMFPFNMKKNNYDIIAWSKTFRSDTYLNGNNEEIELPTKFVEPEIVYYNNSNSLAIQGHPEFSSCDADTVQYCLQLIEDKLFN